MIRYWLELDNQKVIKLEVSAILIEYCEYFEDVLSNIYFFHFAVQQNRKRLKKHKRKIRHLTFQVCYLQQSLVILKMKKMKLKKWLKLQKERPQVNNSQLQPELICRPSTI